MLLSLALVAACSGPAAPRHDPTSRGLRASQHLDAAAEQSARSNELSSWPDQRSTQSPDEKLAAGSWYRTFDTPEAHSRAAQAHRGNAAALQLAYEEACQDRPLIDVSVSPLQRYGKGGAPTSNGVLVFLSPYAGTPDALMAELRCHRAWMMLGPAGMDACPLDLPGLRVSATGDPSGVTVEISVEDPALVPELQRRTMLDLEGARVHGDRGHE